MDGNVVKLVAVQVTIIMLLALYNNYLYLLLFLAIDFAIRAFTHLPSLSAIAAKWFLNATKQKPKLIFSPPKKFAATIGFIFSLSTVILLLLDWRNAAWIVGGVLTLCAFLEAVFNICVGCYLYNWLIAPIINR